jgi:hypothetical protein
VLVAWHGKENKEHCYARLMSICSGCTALAPDTQRPTHSTTPFPLSPPVHTHHGWPFMHAPGHCVRDCQARVRVHSGTRLLSGQRRRTPARAPQRGRFCRVEGTARALCCAGPAQRIVWLCLLQPRTLAPSTQALA